MKLEAKSFLIGCIVSVLLLLAIQGFHLEPEWWSADLLGFDICWYGLRMEVWFPLALGLFVVVSLGVAMTDICRGQENKKTDYPIVRAEVTKIGSRRWRMMRGFKLLVHRNPTRCAFCGAQVDLADKQSIKGFNDYCLLEVVFCNPKHWLADWKRSQSQKEASTKQ